MGKPTGFIEYPRRSAPVREPLVRLNDWYEIYEAAVVRPLLWLSRVVLWKGVDQGVVDGAGVNGSAFVARTFGWLGTRLQTGRVGTYVFLFVVGVLAVVGALTR